jgi:hypothetical protein
MCEPLDSPKGYAPVISSYARFDRASKWIPVLSTITSLWDIACKLYMACWRNPINPDNHYWSYIHDKSYLRCIVLLLPFIGNIAIVIYDLIVRCQTNAILDEVVLMRNFVRIYDPCTCKTAGADIKKDKRFLCLSKNKQNDILQVFTQLYTPLGKQAPDDLHIILKQIRAKERLLPLGSRADTYALVWLGHLAAYEGQSNVARAYYRQAAQEGDLHAIERINTLNKRTG